MSEVRPMSEIDTVCYVWSRGLLVRVARSDTELNEIEMRRTMDVVV